MKINFKIKNKVHTLETSPEETIKSLKDRLEKTIEGESPLKAKDMRFISSGKILKDASTLKELGIEDDTPIFVTGVTAKPKPAEPAAQPRPAPSQAAYPQAGPPMTNAPPLMNPDAMQDIMEKQFEEMINNPSMIDERFGPMLAGMPEAQREQAKQQIVENMKELKNNPESLKEIMNQMSSMDPNTLNEMKNAFASLDCIKSSI